MHHLTKCSLFIECFLNESSTEPLAIGTAFTLKVKTGENFLITNWHCVTGINSETNTPLSRNGHTNPEILNVHFLKKGCTNQWIEKRIPLIDENFQITYIEHPRGRAIDVVAIKLPTYDDVDIHNAFDALIPEEFEKQVTDMCSIVGFPKGISTAGKLPIWKSGTIASELEIDHDDRPIFLVDASTREGMSGSPVYCISKGQTVIGNNIAIGLSEAPINFLGIYSGRIGNDIEIGRVFKPSCLHEIFKQYYQKLRTPKPINSFTYVQQKGPN